MRISGLGDQQRVRVSKINANLIIAISHYDFRSQFITDICMSKVGMITPRVNLWHSLSPWLLASVWLPSLICTALPRKCCFAPFGYAAQIWRGV